VESSRGAVWRSERPGYVGECGDLNGTCARAMEAITGWACWSGGSRGTAEAVGARGGRAWAGWAVVGGIGVGGRGWAVGCGMVGPDLRTESMRPVSVIGAPSATASVSWCKVFSMCRRMRVLAKTRDQNFRTLQQGMETHIRRG
jgi:hypothetical protein